MPPGIIPRTGASIWRHLWRHSSKQKPLTPIAFASPRYTPDHLHHSRGGGDRTRTDDPLLAKQVLSQLSYTPEPEVLMPEALVGQGGFEPPTPRLSSVCSNQLSY